MPIFLFDIDFTVVDSAGAGREAMTSAFESLYGIENAFDGLLFQGRTDEGIIREALLRGGVAESGWLPRSRLVDEYVRLLSKALPRRGGHVLPGARQLVSGLMSEPDTLVGLATGNFRRGAMVKLAHFGLLDLLRDGGFGDDHLTRASMVADAARQVGGVAAASDRAHGPVVMIGDTPDDVEAAHANGFLAAAVATGFHTVEELRASGADLVFADFSDSGAAREALVRLARDGSDRSAGVVD